MQVCSRPAPDSACGLKCRCAWTCQTRLPVPFWRRLLLLWNICAVMGHHSPMAVDLRQLSLQEQGWLSPCWKPPFCAWRPGQVCTRLHRLFSVSMSINHVSYTGIPGRPRERFDVMLSLSHCMTIQYSRNSLCKLLCWLMQCTCSSLGANVKTPAIYQTGIFSLKRPMLV